MIVCVLITAAGCDTQGGQDDFAASASRRPSGYTQTNADGTVVTVDEDDWRTSPAYRGTVRIDPAYPNPVATEFVTVPVTVTQFNSVRGGLVLRAYNSAGLLFRLADIPEARDPGAYVFSFAPGLLGRLGLQRVFVFDTVGEIVSYGDIMVQ